LGISLFLNRTVQHRPNHLAMVCGARRRTWAEFRDRVAQLAGGLQGRGFKTDTRVAILMANSDRYAEMFFGAVWAGGATVPLNMRLNIAEVADSLDDSEAAFLMVDDACADTGLKLTAERKGRVQLIFAGEGPCPDGAIAYESLIEGVAPVPDAGRTGSDLCLILYTGGTTGRAKGVMHGHSSAMIWPLYGMAEGLHRDDAVYLNCMPLFHIGSTWPLFGCIASGATTIMLPTFDSAKVLEAVEAEKVTEILLVPTMIQRFIEDPAFAKTKTDTLKRIIYGASPITEALLNAAVKALPQTGFVQVYGMTEVCAITMLHNDQLHGRGQELGRRRAAGRTTYGMEMCVVDENDKPVPTGTVGEIVVRGPNVMQGYWKRPEETAKALRNGWMHTGDGGYVDSEGYYFVVDRVKDMIISGGENIYSVEVENAISQHPAVQSCAVIGIPHEQWIETVHAVIVPYPGKTVTADEIIAHCRERIARYKCPRSVDVRETPLPLSAAGKILKRVLRDEHLKKSGG
jgi:long-chain acyl-CoA synthetase